MPLRSTGRALCVVVLSFVVVSVRLLRVVFIVFVVDTGGRWVRSTSVLCPTVFPCVARRALCAVVRFVISHQCACCVSVPPLCASPSPVALPPSCAATSHVVPSCPVCYRACCSDCSGCHRVGRGRCHSRSRTVGATFVFVLLCLCWFFDALTYTANCGL